MQKPPDLWRTTDARYHGPFVAVEYLGEQQLLHRRYLEVFTRLQASGAIPNFWLGVLFWKDAHRTAVTHYAR